MNIAPGRFICESPAAFVPRVAHRHGTQASREASAASTPKRHRWVMVGPKSDAAAFTRMRNLGGNIENPDDRLDRVGSGDGFHPAGTKSDRCAPRPGE